ncbi:MAG: YbaB/EbfC family nucleoid-associated protein [Chloroflexota bacterium]|nr:YbaB/EbfC family nucleoid-associated protein [Anaerolineales bacterium]MCB8969110.1 YbaB/EbfC family nucleoid-associated protein [Ardenticatenaceae bacterium]MCB8989204.1 YbaB/EbfC family nucleoid-associated protein [Ardenticatenaceae bacterium]
MTKRSYKAQKQAKANKPNPGNMLSQMQKMQDDMAKAQDALANEAVTITAGGGAISITISGHQRVQTIEINPELIDPEEKEMLQDLLVAAVNQAIEQSQALAAERMEGITGGLGGLGGGLDSLLGGLGI